jgi:hypothetical protein
MHHRFAKKIVENTTRITPAFVLLAFILSVATPSLSQSAINGRWSGQAQCQISVQGQGYSHQETHTWTLNGGPTVQGAMHIFPATWSVTGQGSLQRSQGTQILQAQWTTNASQISAPIALFIRASDGALILKSWHSQLRAPRGVTGIQQVSINGVPQPPGAISLEAFEWAFPLAQVLSTSTSISGSNTVATNGSVGPMQPGGSQGTASCTWNFTAGTSMPAGVGGGGIGATPVMGSTPVMRSTPGSTTPLGGAQNPPAVTGVSIVSLPPGVSTRPVSTNASGNGVVKGVIVTSPPSTPGTGATSGGTTSTAGGQQQTTSSQTNCGAGQQTLNQPVMNTPTAWPGPAAVNLSWAAPANNGGCTIDSYEIETDSTTPPKQLTITAPATTAVVAASACPYPNVSCATPNTYHFRIRAHTSAGYGPYSSYTSQVRPFVSYTVDNLQAVWSTKGCIGCHTSANSPNLATGNIYSNIRSANVISTPPGSSKLLTCPTGGANCNIQPHPQNFTFSSQEFVVIMQWISDGTQP